MDRGRVAVFRYSLITAVILSAALLLVAAHPIEDLGTAGIGLQVVPTERGEVVVLAVLEKSPAMEAGLKPGDLILKIDGFQLQGTDFEQVTNTLLRGDGGSNVTLVYQRPGVSGTYSVSVTRRMLMVPAKVIPGVEMKPSVSEPQK